MIMARNLSRLTGFSSYALIAGALLLCALSAHAQTDGSAARGAITGRVVDEGGQPVANASVFASGQPRGARATSDTDGRFSLDDLARGAYRLFVNTPGYFYPPALAPEPDERSYHHPGDTITLRLHKGGVITGRVLDASGEPLVAVRVGAFRVRPLPDQPQDNVPTLVRPVERATDDRGVYRIYGLPPGVYLVAAGGRGGSGFYFPLSPYDEDAPTYYPAATRAGASEVVVQAGQEATDIDIRYRGERGHAVSGSVVVAPGSNGYVALTIMPAGVNYTVGNIGLTGREDSPSFVFNSLPDGDYDVTAEQYGSSGANERNAAASQRVSVLGADVTGLKLVLAPLAAITGRVVLEAAPVAAQWPAQCQSKLDPVMGEIMLYARRTPDARAAAVAQPAGARLASAAPDDKGAFTLRNLAAGRFRLKLRPPGPDWYIRAATFAAPPAAASKSTARVNAPAANNTNPLADELTLAAGSQLDGLIITLAPGAAALHGRVAPASDGATLPARQVYLVPAERERADDALRYAVTHIRTDGTFTFTQLAPGRYHLLTRPAAPAADALAPLYSDAQTRTQLRRAAAPTEIIELQPCQRLTDYQLRLRTQ